MFNLKADFIMEKVLSKQKRPRQNQGMMRLVFHFQKNKVAVPIGKTRHDFHKNILVLGTISFRFRKRFMFSTSVYNLSWN